MILAGLACLTFNPLKSLAESWKLVHCHLQPQLLNLIQGVPLGIAVLILFQRYRRRRFVEDGGKIEFAICSRSDEVDLTDKCVWPNVQSGLFFGFAVRAFQDGWVCVICTATGRFPLTRSGRMRLPFQEEDPMVFVKDAKPGDRIAALTPLRGELVKRHFEGFNGISGHVSLEVGRNSKLKNLHLSSIFLGDDPASLRCGNQWCPFCSLRQGGQYFGDKFFSENPILILNTELSKEGTRVS